MSAIPGLAADVRIAMALERIADALEREVAARDAWVKDAEEEEAKLIELAEAANLSRARLQEAVPATDNPDLHWHGRMQFGEDLHD